MDLSARSFLILQHHVSHMSLAASMVDVWAPTPIGVMAIQSVQMVVMRQHAQAGIRVRTTLLCTL